MQDKSLEGFRLSPQQEYIWPLQQESGSWAQCAIMIAGVLDRETLRNVLQQLGDRHEILRTTFHRPHGLSTPFQVINEECALLWRETEAQSEQLDEMFAAQARESFDYENGPLMRASLLTLSADRHVLLLTLPTLSADARTLEILCRQLGRAYAGNSSDDAMQYVDFATWQ